MRTYRLLALQAICYCHSRCQLAIKPRFLGAGPGLHMCPDALHYTYKC